MRQKNLRVMIVGAVVMALAAFFFLGMVTVAPSSNNPAELMQIVGQISGVVGALGLVMIGFGFIGRKPPR